MISSRVATHRSHRPARQVTVSADFGDQPRCSRRLLGHSRDGCHTSQGESRSVATSAAVTKCPHGTAAGVTSKQITVAATVIDISGGSVNNATYGVPSAADQESDWKLVADHINKAGGIGCRKIVLDLYPVNSFDASGAQQVCLTIAATHPFIVLDPGVLTEIGASDCLPAHKVPLASEYLTEAAAGQVPSVLPSNRWSSGGHRLQRHTGTKAARVLQGVQRFQEGRRPLSHVQQLTANRRKLGPQGSGHTESRHC